MSNTLFYILLAVFVVLYIGFTILEKKVSNKKKEKDKEQKNDN